MNKKLVAEFVNELRTADYWYKPDGKPLKNWVLIERSTLKEARDAARAAALDNASEAVRDKVWRIVWNDVEKAARTAGIMEELECVHDDVWCATWSAARTAAWDSVGDGVGVVDKMQAWFDARDAAMDAMLVAGLLVVSNQKPPREFLEHANKRMEVWRKGYCLLGDMDGTLYVYAKKREKVKLPRVCGHPAIMKWRSIKKRKEVR